MKRVIKIVSVVFLSLILLVGVFAVTVTLSARTLEKNIDTDSIDIFVPKGLANRYTDPMSFSFDDFRIWEYRLNDKEVRQIEADLENGIWQKPTQEEFEDVLSEFFLYGGPEKPEFSNEVYYCPVDSFPGKGHRTLFVYDAFNRIYRCVTMCI
ncbi:MAG: hypothetical protein ACI4SB_04045 [Acutalibacteraceae bacterium]